MPTIEVRIVSQKGEVYNGKANVVNADAQEGGVGIYPGHAPLLALLRPGEVKVQTEGKEDLSFFVAGGMLEVQPDLVTVLADTVERSEDLDKDRAEAAKKQAETFSQKGDISPEDRARAVEQLAEAVARLRLIEELQKRH